MENLKSSIADKIKKLNLLFSFIEQEESSISKIDVDSFAEMIRALYMDALELDNFVGKTTLQEQTNKTAGSIIFPADTEIIKSIEQEVHFQQEKEKEIVRNTENIAPNEYKETEIDETQEQEVVVESIIIEPETSLVQDEEIDNNIFLVQDEMEMNEAQMEQSVVAETIEQEILSSQTEKRETVHNTEIASAIESEITIAEEKQVAKQETETTQVVENVVFSTETKIDIASDSVSLPHQENAQTKLQLEEIDEKTEPAEPQKSAEPISVLNYLKSKNVENASQNAFNRYGNSQDTPKVQTIADKFTSEKSSIFETIASQSDDKSVNSKLQKQAVNDLRDIIGLNDKILFVKDLFAGNSGDYNNFLLALNDSKSAEEIEAVLQVLKQHYNWEQNFPGTYANLLQYIERKFH